MHQRRVDEREVVYVIVWDLALHKFENCSLNVSHTVLPEVFLKAIQIYFKGTIDKNVFLKI